MTIREAAEKIIATTGSKSKIVFKPLPVDDPMRRKPDITKASSELGWSPKVNFDDGLKRTIENFDKRLKNGEKP
jgi:UDP-glucuronate decarboxylase